MQGRAVTTSPSIGSQVAARGVRTRSCSQERLPQFRRVPAGEFEEGRSINHPQPEILIILITLMSLTHRDHDAPLSPGGIEMIKAIKNINISKRVTPRASH